MGLVSSPMRHIEGARLVHHGPAHPMAAARNRPRCVPISREIWNGRAFVALLGRQCEKTRSDATANNAPIAIPQFLRPMRTLVSHG